MEARGRAVQAALVVVTAAGAVAFVQGCGDATGDPAPLAAPAGRAEPGLVDPSYAQGAGASSEVTTPVSSGVLRVAARPVAASAAATTIDGHTRFVVAYEDASTVRGDADARMPSIGMNFAYSDDGEHWTRGEVTDLAQSPVAIAATLGSPAIASQPDHPDVYYAALAVRPGYDPERSRVVVVAHSTDGGATFLPPVIATMPQIGVPFDTVDSPSITVDESGLVHLVVVSDQGTPRAQIQHWIGMREVAGCTYTCMRWQPATGPSIDPADAPYIRHPVIRAYHRGAFYLAYEVRVPLAEPTASGDDATLRVELRRYDLLYDSWDPTDEQPAAGATLGVREGATGAGAVRMDLAVDPHTGDGMIVTVGDDATGSPDGHDALRLQRFRFDTAFSEVWQPAVVVATGAAGTPFQPTASLAGSVRAVTWLEQDTASGRVRLMGARSDDGGETFAPTRNLTQLAGGADDASMPVCANGANVWSAYGSSVTAADAQGTLMTLTAHVGATEAPCDVVPPRAAATRWGLPVP